MNNEDKILSMLEQMSSWQDRTALILENLTSTVGTLVVEQQKTNQRLDKLEQGQANLEQRQANLEQGQANLEQRLDKLEQEVLHTRVLLEETQREVRIIAEGHLALNRKLDSLLNRYDAEDDIRVLQVIVAQHSRDIEELKLAK